MQIIGWIAFYRCLDISVAFGGAQAGKGGAPKMLTVTGDVIAENYT